jgi:exonuclease VII small subunit
MSTKQDLEEIRQRAQRECFNLRTSMESRDCSEEEIEERCQEILKRAEERVAHLVEQTRMKD